MKKIERFVTHPVVLAFTAGRFYSMMWEDTSGYEIALDLILCGLALFFAMTALNTDYQRTG